MLAGSPAIDMGVSTVCPARDQIGNPRPSGSGCDAGAFEYQHPLIKASALLSAAPVAGADGGAAKNPDTCGSLPAHIQVQTTTAGANCQVVGAAGIGIQSVIDVGFVAAVDVWGWLGAGAKVCIAGTGSITFIDAANAPKFPGSLPASYANGMTCAELTTPGTVILVPGPASDSPSMALSGCMVTTSHVLNLRLSPGGRIIGVVPADATLTALARTDSWFKVDFIGVTGWISADYASPAGSCG